MGNSLALALYLATRARADKPARRSGKPSEGHTKTLENERLGRPELSRPETGPLIWFHTGRDRHALACRELISRLRAERGELGFLLTTSSENRKESEDHLNFQLAPDDAVPAVRRFLDHWRPDIAVFTEPDLRPALIAETSDRGIPMFLVDAHTARLDPQSWRWLRGMAGSLLSRFQWLLTGDAETAGTLRRLGARSGRVQVVGYLEEGTPALGCNEAERDALAEALAGRPVWLAAHVTPGECTTVIDAHAAALRRSHRLVLILVPDDPQEGPAWAAKLAEGGNRVALRSDGAEPDPETQIYVADTEGEMGLWYRLAPISFLGRSISGDGGVNPYQPAALGSAILHGPNVRNFRQAYGRLGAAGATRLVRNATELGDAVEQLLSPDAAAGMAHAAWRVCSSGAEVTDRIRELIFATLDEMDTP